MPATKPVIISKFVAVVKSIDPPQDPLSMESAHSRAMDVITAVPFTKPPIAVAIHVITILTGKAPTIKTIHNVVGHRIGGEAILEENIRALCGDKILIRSRDRVSIHPTIITEVKKVLAAMKAKQSRNKRP